MTNVLPPPDPLPKRLLPGALGLAFGLGVVFPNGATLVRLRGGLHYRGEATVGEVKWRNRDLLPGSIDWAHHAQLEREAGVADVEKAVGYAEIRATAPDPLPKTLPPGTRAFAGPPGNRDPGDGFIFAHGATLSANGATYEGLFQGWHCPPENVDWSRYAPRATIDMRRDFEEWLKRRNFGSAPNDPLTRPAFRADTLPVEPSQAAKHERYWKRWKR